MRNLTKRLLVLIAVMIVLLSGWRYWTSQHPEPAFSLDDLMILLVEPRHAKLCLAAKANNWELAAFELKNLRQSLEYIIQVKPSYQGSDVGETVTALFAPQLLAMDQPIANADQQGFLRAFVGLTQACNDCHVYHEHPFIRMATISALDECSESLQTFKSDQKALTTPSH